LVTLVFVLAQLGQRLQPGRVEPPRRPRPASLGELQPLDDVLAILAAGLEEDLVAGLEAPQPLLEVLAGRAEDARLLGQEGFAGLAVDGQRDGHAVEVELLDFGPADALLRRRGRGTEQQHRQGPAEQASHGDLLRERIPVVAPGASRRYTLPGRRPFTVIDGS